MIAAAFRFPSSFLDSLTFIFHGDNTLSFLDSFHDIQDLERHTQNVMSSINYYTNEEDYEFADTFYGKYINREAISIDEIKRYFGLAPSVCTMEDLVIGDDALRRVKLLHPDALCR